MKKIVSAILLLALIALTGCTHKIMLPVDKPEPIPAGLSSITFFKDSAKGGFAQAPIVELTQQDPLLVGVSSTGKKIRHIATPGEHTYLIAGTHPFLLKANLAPDKHYYVFLEVTSPETAKKYSFKPRVLTPHDLSSEKIQKEIRTKTLIKKTDIAEKWLQRRLNSILIKSSIATSEYKEENGTSRNFILPEDGIDILY